MDILSFLQESTQRFGPSGYEQALAKWLQKQFAPYCDDVSVDAMGNVFAVQKPTAQPQGAEGKGGNAPKIMLFAHMDEIALLVTDILEDGSLRVGRVGGVGTHILPAATVTVHTETGELFGVIGAKPPHLLDGEEQKQSAKYENLYVDLGMPLEAVQAKVNIGDMVTLHGETVALLNNRAAGKTMDDRSCIAVMLNAAERLQKIRHEAEVVFCCTVQEEVGCRGAKTAAYTVNPDIGFVLDVTFASYPGARPDTTVPPDAPAPVCGPYIQPKLLDILKDTARKNNINYNLELNPMYTGTDTDAVQIARDGIPTVLVGLPLSYMHTTVETVDCNVISECGRLAAAFCAEITEGWDTDLWN